MSVRRVKQKDSKTGKVREFLMVDVDFELPNGSRERVRKVSPVQTKRGAEQYERELRAAILDGSWCRGKEENAVPTLAEFSSQFVEEYAETNNKESEVDSKRSILKLHLEPVLGRLRLDEIGKREIEAYKRAKLKGGFTKKTINNQLTVLRKLLATADEWEVIAGVPRIRWFQVDRPTFRFLSFDEADRLIAGTAPEWRALVTAALRTGLRRGELLGLRWNDIDFVNGNLSVERAWVRKRLTTPKNGRSRTVPLCDEVVQALKAHRHLRGPWVFCSKEGSPLTKDEIKHPLRRALIKAGLWNSTPTAEDEKKVGWHVLRHTFASHLVMRGASLKVVQELMGHQTIEMTMRYAHLSPNVKQEAVKLLDRRPDVKKGGDAHQK